MADSPRLEQIRALLRADPQDPFLQYALAMEYASAGDDAVAIAAFRELVATQPDYVPTYLMLAQTLHRLGSEPEAADVLRSGIIIAKKAGEEHALSELQAMLALVE